MRWFPLLLLTLVLGLTLLWASSAPSPASPPLSSPPHPPAPSPSRGRGGEDKFFPNPLPREGEGGAQAPGEGASGEGAKGEEPLTSYARLTARLRRDAQKSAWIKVTALGKSATGTRTVWLARVANPSLDSARAARILILCRQHGDEPAATEAMLGMLGRVADGEEPQMRAALGRVVLYVVPMLNPDGADANTRRNAKNADLNRDWGVFAQPETRAVADAAALIRPHLVLDAHNWDGGDHYDANCLEVARADQTPLEQAAHAVQQDGVSALARSGFNVYATAYGREKSPTLAHRWFAAQGALSLLVETHSGSPQDQADFLRRQELYAALIRFVADGCARRAWPLPAVAQNTSDAALFPAAPSPSHPAAARRPLRPVRLWLWALCAYGLVVWTLRSGFAPPAPAPRRPITRKPPTPRRR